MQGIKANVIECSKVLVPTGISIAPYVINPYRGCGFGCIYCYSQKNKCFRKRTERWGEFVDVKINCPEILESELIYIKPDRVLLGSTTEVYQQIEEKYSLTRGIIELLNRHNIPITILTKSRLILRDIDILYNAQVCFTVNLHNDISCRFFEPNSPSIEDRFLTVRRLREKGIYTYIHVGPILPGFTDVEQIMGYFFGITDRLDFESFNYWMSPPEAMDTKINKEIFMFKEAYCSYWEDLRRKIIELNRQFGYKINFYFHPFKEYWQQPASGISSHFYK